MSTKESRESSGTNDYITDYRGVWRFIYETQQRMVHSEWNEVVTDGWRPITLQFDVLAANEDLAKAAWRRRYGFREAYPPDDHYSVKLVSGPELICYIDAEITVHAS